MRISLAGRTASGLAPSIGDKPGAGLRDDAPRPAIFLHRSRLDARPCKMNFSLRFATASLPVGRPGTRTGTAGRGNRARHRPPTESVMHPYQSLPQKHFWRSAVAQRNFFDIEGLWEPRFDLREYHPVSTFGSCFAQHIGKALAARHYAWLDAEPAPLGLSVENRRRFNYGVFSARTGNIYTVSLLHQWLRWSFAEDAPSHFWEQEGRYVDPFRPNIEPGAFESPDELLRSRGQAIEAFRAAVTESRVFVFTLGLTESWFDRRAGYEYPMCPGTVAGTFDEASHEFRAQSFEDVKRALDAALGLLRRHNPALHVILTVSPVPLTATNSGQHVLVATMQSKSVLRAVAGEATAAHDFVDYFPSYEMISSPVFRGTFFEPNLRSINPAGVDFVMDTFFECLAARFGASTASLEGTATPGTLSEAQLRRQREDAVCEEELLGAFGERR